MQRDHVRSGEGITVNFTIKKDKYRKGLQTKRNLIFLIACIKLSKFIKKVFSYSKAEVSLKLSIHFVALKQGVNGFFSCFVIKD